MQRLECLGDGFIVDVPDTVEEEEVGAQLLSGGPGFDAGEVDVADGELGQRRHQRAGDVVEAQHYRGAVGSGAARRRSRLPGQHEPGARVRLVDDVGGQRRQAVAFGRQRRAHAGVGAPVGDVVRGRRVRVGRHHLRVRQVFGQPMPHLRRGHREGRDRLDVGGRACPVARRW